MTQALAKAVIVRIQQSLSVSVSASTKLAGLDATEQARSTVANAVGAALNTTDESGSPPAASAVREVAETALQDSAEELRQVGASVPAVDEAVKALGAHLSSLFGAFAAAAPGAQGDSITAAATSARLVTKEKGVLELHTREGDVVRIRFGTRIDVKAQGTIASDGASSYNALDVSAKVRNASAISIQGDLSEQELAAIADLVGKVDALANEFFAGNVDKAFAAASALQLDDGPLAEFALKLSVSHRYSESNVQSRQTLPSRAPYPAAAPVEPAETAETPQAAPSEATQPPVAADTGETSDSVPVETSVPAQQSPQSIQAIVAKFVARSLLTFQSDTTTARLGVSTQMKFQLLVAAIEATAPASTEATDQVTSKLASVAETATAKGDTTA